MDDNVLQEMLRMADAHFRDDELKGLLKTCIQDKAWEGSVWSNLTLNVHYMLGGRSPSIERVAALTEMAILSLDITDDLQDQDHFGKPWMQWPQAYALNVVLSFQALLMTELGAMGHTRLMHEAGKLLIGSIEGQQSDVSQSVASEADYLTMVRQKSGSLIRLACRMGYSLIEGLDSDTVDQINELADCIGIMAQIENDRKDVLRYDVKNDMLHKKRTLPVLFLLEDSKEEFPAISQFYEGEISAEQFLRSKTECLQYVRDSGCLEYCEVIRILHADRAGEILESLPALSPWKERFKEIAFG